MKASIQTTADLRRVLDNIAGELEDQLPVMRDQSIEVVRAELGAETRRFSRSGELAASFRELDGRIVSSAPYARAQDIGAEIVARRMLLRDAAGAITASAERVRIPAKRYVARAVEASTEAAGELARESVIEAMIDGGARR